MIKFRGQRADTKEWVYGYLLKMFGVISIMPLNDENTIFPIIPETVGQYIGKNDKNGKEIYKGDLFFVYGEYDNGLYVEDRSGYVYVDYNEQETMYQTRAANGEWLENFNDYSYEANIEIAGNIYDNKDLLDVKQ
jgi:uncharacterized phage protein (TIGR01671 family)